MRSFESDDRQYAYHVLRGFLHALRDRIPIDESAQLAAQLPVLIRGIYYEGWVPSHTPQTYHDARGRSWIAWPPRQDLAGETQASFAASAAARVLRAHVSRGELEDVISVLPPPVREIFTD